MPNWIWLAVAVAAVVIAAVAIIISTKKKKPTAMQDEAIPEEAPVTEYEGSEEASGADAVSGEIGENEEYTEGSESEAEEEEIPEDELCIHCGEKRFLEGSEYCEDCTKKLLKTKIPFLGWIFGFTALLVSLFATAQVFLVSSIAIQSVKGDEYAAENCWYAAYYSYGETSTVMDELTNILGRELPFIKIGCGLKAKQVEAAANAYSPLEAGNSISTVFSVEEDGYVSRNKKLQSYKKLLEIFQSSYNAITTAGGDMVYEGASVEEVEKAFLSVKGQEGVNDVFVYYMICNAAEYLDGDNTEMLAAKYDALDKVAKATGENYSWLYYQDFASLYIKMNQPDKAISMMDEMLERDKGNYKVYLTKLRAYMLKGEKDKAQSLIADFTKYNDTVDAKYVLDATFYRLSGEYDKVKELCTEAFQSYDYIPELHRQLAISYLLQKDYDNAYEEAYAAEERAYYLYSMGDSSGYTDELVNTVYICTALAKKYGTGKSENAENIDSLLESYSQEEVSETAKNIVDGKITVEEVFTKGVCDLL